MESGSVDGGDTGGPSVTECVGLTHPVHLTASAAPPSQISHGVPSSAMDGQPEEPAQGNAIGGSVDVVDLLPIREMTFEEAQRDPALLSIDVDMPGSSKQANGQWRTRTSNGSTQSKSSQRSRRSSKRQKSAEVAGKEIGGGGDKSKEGIAMGDRTTKGAQTGPKADKAAVVNVSATPRETLPPKERDLQRAREYRLRDQIRRAIENAEKIEISEAELQFFRKKATAWSSTGVRENTDRIERLGRQMQGLWQSTRPSNAQATARSRVMQDVDAALKRRWPGCGLHVVPFGSTLTGLVEANSDVDLCLIDPTRPLGVGTPSDQVLSLPQGARHESLRNTRITGIANVPDYYSVRLIGHALEHVSMRGVFAQVFPLQHANVPIVKFIHRPTGLACDLNVNDSFGQHNSKMIREYIDIAPAVLQPFIFTIKKWASVRAINDPSGESGLVTFNSYTVVLLALQYLQMTGVVPNLQDQALLNALDVPNTFLWQKPKGKGTIAAAANVPDADVPTKRAAHPSIVTDELTGARQFNTTFATLDSEEDVEIAEQVAGDTVRSGKPFRLFRTSNQDEISVLLGNMLVGFFEWLEEFDFTKCGLSLREGHAIRRMDEVSADDVKLRAYPYVPPMDAKWSGNVILCQDPFILDRNTTGAIQKKGKDVIEDEIERAVDIVRSGKDPALAELLEPFEHKHLLDLQEKITKQFSPEQRAAYESQYASSKVSSSASARHPEGAKGRPTVTVKRRDPNPKGKSKSKEA